jgi:pullulanase
MNWNFGHIDFSSYPSTNELLGAFCSREETTLRVWAPTTDRILLRLYHDGLEDAHFELIDLVKRGPIWEKTLSGDYHGIYYTIQCLIDNKWMDEIPDPAAFAVGVNGKRGMFCNFDRTHPEGWESDQRVLPNNPTDMVIYELHVRDFSIDPYSGIKQKGKYLAFTEEGTRSPEGLMTGLDHLLQLGITHVHLLPVFDFFTVDEAHPERNEYNWGYDPLNYNAPEGSYATNPREGSQRIKEFKSLVQALHQKGIGVILDVVYNHTGLINHSYFNQTVPGYYYRQRSNGTFSDASGCGTEIASERTMVRKYIIDSLNFWAKEYHLDGFRFDLMGIYDLETVKIVRREMDQIDPRLVLYGEGWTAAESPMPDKHRAVKSNTRRLERVAMFNDDFRDTLKGSWGSPGSLGFVSGKTIFEENVKLAITGGTAHPQINFDYIASMYQAWNPAPAQSINYVSCHDNYTLYDQLKRSRPEAGLYELSRMVCLAGSLVLTSQGIPFLHAGIEFMRSKKGHGNTYKSGDEYNQLDWSRKAMFNHVFDYYRKLIAIRKAHPAFRMTERKQLEEHLKFSEKYLPGVVAYELSKYANNDSWKHIQLIFNNNQAPVVFPVKLRKWTEIVNGLAIDPDGICCHESASVFVPPVSMMMLVAD